MATSGHLPPSVEKAYYRKCIELRRRISEIEEHNDAARLRIKRINRAVLKMRLERAFLLEQLQSRMEYNVDDSDRSSASPPVLANLPGTAQPLQKPYRMKKSHRKGSPSHSQHEGGGEPSHLGASSPPAPPSSHAGHHLARPPMPGVSSAQSTPNPERSGVFFAPGSGSPNASLNGARGPPPPSGGPMQISPIERTAGFGPPPPQPQFYDRPSESYDDERRRSPSSNHENGEAGERPAGPFATGGGASGEMLGAGPDIRVDANGERRITSDTEMREQNEEDREAPGFSGGGFTAVNR